MYLPYTDRQSLPVCVCLYMFALCRAGTTEIYKITTIFFLMHSVNFLLCKQSMTGLESHLAVMLDNIAATFGKMTPFEMLDDKKYGV